MKKLILLLSLISTAAIAAPGVGTLQVYEHNSGSRNYVKNPSARKNTAGTTTSSASIARVTTSGNKLDGFASYTCDSSATSGYCEFALDTIEDGDKTGNCEFSGQIKGDGSLYSAQITDGSGNVKNARTLGSVTDWTGFQVTYPCQSSAKVRITQTTAGTAPALGVGRLYYGKLQGLGNVSDLSNWKLDSTTIVPTNFGTVSNANIYTRRDGDSLDVRGYFAAGTSVASPAAIALNGLTIDFGRLGTQAGQGLVGWSTNQKPTSGASGVASGGWMSPLFTDGSNSDRVFFGNQTESNAYLKINGSSLAGSGTYISFDFSVPISGWSASNVAFQSDTTAASWSGYHTVASGWATTSATYADPSAGSTIVLNPTTVRNMTCTSAGSSLPGITCTVPKAGIYKVCALLTAGSSATSVGSVRLVDGSGTIIDAGRSYGMTGTSETGYSVCGKYNVTSTATSPTFKIQLANTGSSTLTIANARSSGGAIQWDVENVDQGVSAPVVTSSATSSSAVAERNEYLAASCGSSGTSITLQSNWLSSLSNGGSAGQCSGVLKSAFPSGAVCTCGADGQARSCNAVISGTAMSLTRYNADGSGSAENGAVQVHCWGPR